MYLVLAAVFLAGILAYNIAVKNTIKTIKDYRELKRKSSEAADLPAQCALLSNQLSRLNQLYFNAVKGIGDTHEIFLDKLGRLADQYNTSVIEYPEKHSFNTSSVQIETHNAVLKGSFTDLLKVLYELEVHERIGRLVAVEYYTETNRKTKIRSLYMRIYIQNYRNKNNNENN